MAASTTSPVRAGRVLVVGCGALAADLCALGVDATADDAAAAARAALDGVDVVVLDETAGPELLSTVAAAFPAVLTLVVDPGVTTARVSSWRGPTQDVPVVHVPGGAAEDLLRWIRAAIEGAATRHPSLGSPSLGPLSNPPASPLRSP